MPDLDPSAWLLLAAAAFGIGVSKSGLAGVGLVHVLVFAVVFGARRSTGILLPLLVVGDVCAVALVGRQVSWPLVRRLMGPALCGVLLGWVLLDRLDEAAFRPLIGWLVLGLAAGQILRMWRPDLLERVPHSAGFAWGMGILTGITTMVANAAGPVVALYLLALALPKDTLVATGAWFFLILNLAKLPFSAQLGLIEPETLGLDMLLAPLVVAGLVCGRAVVRRIPQRLFDTLLLAFTGVAALRLVVAR